MLALTLMALAAEPVTERYDHHGAIGLVVGVHGARKDIGGVNVVPDSGWRTGLDLGATFNVGYHSNEVIIVGRVALGGAFESSAYTGYRNYFGADRWKTLLDLDLAFQFTPFFTVGPRFGVGVQYEFAPIGGVYLQLAGNIGIGQVLMYKIEAVLGVQLRSFLLE